MGFYEIKQVEPWLYSIYDPLNVYCYLLVGEEKALLYDTVYGIGDLNAAIRGITDKPYTVVLGHGHVDHANGAYQFESVYMNDADLDLCRSHTSPAFRENAVKSLQSLKENGHEAPDGFDPAAYLAGGTGNIKSLNAGETFDLGGLHVETVAMPGHTPGSLGLLIPEKKVLLDSDAANGHIWMFLQESLPIGDYVKMLDAVYALDFDYFYIGHSNEPQPKEMFMKYKKVALEATIEKSSPYNVFTELEPYYYEGEGEEKGVGIVFSAASLR
jgi:glyoxylase-like metal-dependent hydrolase (beta-lactamase superfamily II)